MQITYQLSRAITDLMQKEWMPECLLNKKIKNIINNFGYLFFTETDQKERLIHFIENGKCDKSLIKKIKKIASEDFADSVLVFEDTIKHTSKKRKKIDNHSQYLFQIKKIKTFLKENGDIFKLLPCEIVERISNFLLEIDLLKFLTLNKNLHSHLYKGIANYLIDHRPKYTNFMTIFKSARFIKKLDLTSFFRKSPISEQTFDQFIDMCTALQSLKIYSTYSINFLKQTNLEELYIEESPEIVMEGCFSKLTSLIFKDGVVNSNFENLMNLRELDFHNEDNIDFNSLTHLTHLCMKCNGNFSPSEIFFNVPDTIKTMEILTMEEFPAQDKIINLSKFTNLKSLDYYSENESCLDINTLNKGLKELYLGGCLDFINVPGFIRLTNLEILDVGYIEDASYLMHLPSNLQTLILRKPGILRENLYNWSYRENHLKELCLESKNKIIINLDGLSNNTSLTSLKLSNVFFENFVNFLNLKKLGIQSNDNITVDLTELLNTSNLVSLKLYNIVLENFTNLGNLKKLVLESNYNEKIHFTEISNNTSLTTLKLKGIFFNHSLSLEKLSLAFNEVSHCGLIEKNWLGKDIKNLKLSNINLKNLLEYLEIFIKIPEKSLILKNCSNIPEKFEKICNVKIYDK